MILLEIQNKLNEVSKLLISISNDIDLIEDKELQDKLAEHWLIARKGKGEMSMTVTRAIKERSERNG